MTLLSADEYAAHATRDIEVAAARWNKHQHLGASLEPGLSAIAHALLALAAAIREHKPVPPIMPGAALRPPPKREAR